MDYNSPSSYKNYLPSKKMQVVIGVVILAVAAYFIIPPILHTLKKHPAPAGPTPVVTFGIPTGDPTTRDSTGQGIPDWELIAVGISPSDPTALLDFDKLRAKMSPTELSNLENQTTDTDKISLTAGDDLDNDASIEQGITGNDVDQATGTEILNYIASIQAKNTLYSMSDLTVVPSSYANATAYQAGIKKISFVTLTDTAVWQHIAGYIQGTEDASATDKILTRMKASIASMEALPVPEPIATNELTSINALSGFYQTLNAYDPSRSSDQAYQFGTIGALQNYIHDYILSEGTINIYLPIAINPSNYTTP